MLILYWQSLMEENEELKEELHKFENENIELESMIEDLKKTLKLTEKESQVKI